MSYNNYTPNDYESQVQKTLKKCEIKRSYNKAVVDWFYSHNLPEYALAVEECATFVGFTNIDNVAHIVKSNFCRKRLCNICAWRRQSKFTAQMFPVINILSEKGYKFIFATATIPNVTSENLKSAINMLMSGYDRLLKHRKIKRAWRGKIRALEVTYNAKANTFHPHIHIMIAVTEDYFSNPDLYISQEEFREYWEESLHSMFEYPLQVDIRAVDSADNGVVEVLKYSFKSSQYDTAIQGFYECLQGRRLVSFSGVFAQIRKELKYTDFDLNLNDDVEKNGKTSLKYQLYRFDVTGGVYTFFKEYDLN